LRQYIGTEIALPASQEGTMHIHGNSMTVNAANFYSATQEERAAAARRAASVRKNLIRSASEMEGTASPEETLMIGQWMDSRHSQVQSEEQYYNNLSGKDPDLG
jgi:hypothetical protein